MHTALEPAFFEPAPRSFTYPPQLPARLLLQHLQRHLIRQPRDLLGHVLRISCTAAHDDAAALGRALAELFLVLGPAGAELRRRLLQTHAARLPAAWQELLSAGLDAGMTAPLAWPDGIPPLAADVLDANLDWLVLESCAPAESLR